MSGFFHRFSTPTDRMVRFLWLHPKIIHLQGQRTDKDIENALQSFPNELGLTYSKILDSIDKLPGPRRMRVQRALRWVTYAKRPLTLRELSEAVAIGEMEDSDIWDEARCVNEPSSLIEDTFDLIFRAGNPWRSPDAEVHISHTSVIDFISGSLTPPTSSPHLSSSPPITIIRECFRYLSMVARQQPGHQHPFLGYACSFWPEHLRDAGTAGEELVGYRYRTCSTFN